VKIDVDYYEDFIEAIISGAVSDRKGIMKLKTELCKLHGLSRVPTNHEILEHVPDELRGMAEPLLKNKPVRTLSGVAPVAVMTSPFDCPHGRCSYCPGGVSNNSPQSYTGREPAALRATMNEFDPFRQTEARLKQFKAIGHHTDKVDLIIMGGTFTSRPPEYQEWFVKRCFDAMNGCDSDDIMASHELNETAESRCVGLTVETRPDWFNKEQLSRSMHFGATKVEFGVQILDDDVLTGVKRGHGVREVVDATERARNAGLKICYHMMPGLPGSTFEKDLESFKRLFKDDRFRPDMLKIYPTLVVKGTDLYELWTAGGYSPFSVEDGTRMLSEVKKQIPPWVRILRIQRDIPVQLIEAGIRKSHLRELVHERLASEDSRCRCIRCREIGHVNMRGKGKATTDDTPELRMIEYSASRGKELFISYELPSMDALIGYARLRFPSDGSGNHALVRELHVYGQMVPIGMGSGGQWQHRGLGESLLRECEMIASGSGYDELFVTSGVGARGYYRGLGYDRKGHYMSKPLC